MIRTIISLEDDEKTWLDAKARELGKPMTAVVRDAVARYRAEDRERAKPAIDALLMRTAGLWNRGEGLAYQKKLRGEWDRR